MDVLEWAARAQVGESVTYANRTGDDYSDKVAMDTAYRAHQKGLVFLAQRRQLHGFRYVAVRVSTQTAKFLQILPHQQFGLTK